MNRLDRYLLEKSWHEKAAALETIRKEIQPRLDALRFWEDCGQVAERSQLKSQSKQIHELLQ